jgi:GT2 family glycosyltransferase
VSSVDVVIVAYQSRDRLDGLVRALCDAPTVGRVVVVDHGSDGSADVAAGAGAFVIRDPSNPGFAAGQNHGLAATDAEFVLVLNPDLEFRVDVLPAAVAILSTETRVAGVQGSIVNVGTGRAERSGGMSIRPVHLVGRLLRARRLLQFGPVRAFSRRFATLRDHVDRVPADQLDVEALAATAVLFRRRALLDVGGFDERFFLYGEDLDLCWRLREAGWRLLMVSEVWAHHGSGESSSDTWSRELAWWEGTLAFTARHWRTRAFAIALSVAVVRATTLGLRRPKQFVEVWRRLIGGTLRCRRLRGSRPVSP